MHRHVYSFSSAFRLEGKLKLFGFSGMRQQPRRSTILTLMSYLIHSSQAFTISATGVRQMLIEEKEKETNTCKHKYR